MKQLARQTLFLGMVAVAIPAGVVPAVAACNKTINITEKRQMNFATIIPTSGGGAVTISSSGAVVAPGGFVVTGVPAAGTFLVGGTNGCFVAISFTPGMLTGPGAAMALGNFTNNAGPAPHLDPAGGQLTFSVGADLQVNAGQAGGNYSGTYAVTVVYN